MIPESTLPGGEARLDLFQTAQALFITEGFDEIGIDHFARPCDGLAQAAATGRLRRNFQGYTDDPAEVLLGLGASSIARFPHGYVQNAPATGAYTALVRAGQLPVSRGHAFTPEDHWRGRMIEMLMCSFRIDMAEIEARFGISATRQAELFAQLLARFGTALRLRDDGLEITPAARPLTRMIAQALDGYSVTAQSHSSAI
jgi:oxygen-independent coproporphyrinogen-3 oxidase